MKKLKRVKFFKDLKPDTVYYSDTQEGIIIVLDVQPEPIYRVIGLKLVKNEYSHYNLLVPYDYKIVPYDLIELGEY